MNRKELEQRLRQELALPYYNAKIAERDYSESEFQEMKAQLQADIEQYARDYVNESMPMAKKFTDQPVSDLLQSPLSVSDRCSYSFL